ncbi:hypothetical protein HY087_00260 [Candidatus Gottesmanbacteria bacterium]|nr:hypothetical protein [Candidatus Gottesmanbacteria bacterium]
MEENQETSPQAEGSMTYYVLGALVVVVIAVGAYVLRPKSANGPSTTGSNVVMPVADTPTPGPITGLACERQWYNPVNYLPKYYLGVDGVDLMSTKKVSCNFTVNVSGKVVATTSAQSTLTEASGRGGGTFRCDSPQLALEANTPTVVDVTLKNDSNQTASCSQTFVLPQP